MHSTVLCFISFIYSFIYFSGSFLSLRKLDLFSEDNYEDTNQNPSDPESSML